jgi:hypothetical protein
LTSPFSSNLAATVAPLLAIAGESVTYTAGDGLTATLTAAPGSSVWESLETEGHSQAVTSVDWIAAAPIVVAGQEIEPEVGHTIEWAHDGKTHKFRLGVPFGDDRPFTYSDHTRTRLRLHTTYVGLA